MMPMCMLRKSSVTLKQFADAVCGNNAQALPMMSSAPLDFPCVLFSLYCKSDQATLAELPNILLRQPRGQKQTCMHVHAEISFSVYMFKWRGRVGLIKAYSRRLINLEVSWETGMIYVLLFFILPDAAKSSSPSLPYSLSWICPLCIETSPQSRTQLWARPRQKAARAARHR